MAVPIVASGVAVLMIAGGLACSNGTPGQVEPTIGQTRQLTYLALGDSYTIGEGVDVPDRWPVQLVERLRSEGIRMADPEIIARSRWTANRLAVQLNVAAPDGPYDLVTLMIGVNDQFGGLPVEGYRDEFAALLSRAVALADDRPSHVIVVSIPDWGVTPFADGRKRDRIAMEIDLFNQVNREEAERASARYVDVTPISREAATDPSLLAADGLHPSSLMYARWVDLIVGPAREVLTASVR
jgi:lysophospholipase L1-like esterase